MTTTRAQRGICIEEPTLAATHDGHGHYPAPCMEIWNAMLVALNTAAAVWREALVGGVAITASTWVGWHFGNGKRRWFLAPIDLWLDHVVRPLCARKRWIQRATVIALNNTGVCFAVTILGAVPFAAWPAVLGLGLGLGIGLRRLQATFDVDDGGEPMMPTHDGNITLGLALNLLEIPAILLAAGLSLAQGSLGDSIALSEAVITFSVVGLPLIMIAAGGEALWMSRIPNFNRRPSSEGQVPPPEDL